MTKATLVRELFDGPIDIVGDVHGETEALRTLLGRLGYGVDGRHPEGRRLVFVGDLGDRGPDSPGVVLLVRWLVQQGLAQAVVGNHELNALRARRVGKLKPELSWLFPRARPFRHKDCHVPQVLAGDRTADILDFFATLPVALERGGPQPVRVVHACWDQAAIDTVRFETDVMDVFLREEARINRNLHAAQNADHDDRELAHQNGNPIKLLTSGREVRSATPIVINEKPRHRVRQPWWNGHAGQGLTVVGHYWRVGLPGEEHEAHLFGGRARHALLGRVMCIDYSVGRRFRERLESPLATRYLTSLGALRLPERVLYFDNLEPMPLLG